MIRVIDIAGRWCVFIPFDIAKELPKNVRYCEVYYSVNPRIIVLDFLNRKTKDSIYVELYRRGLAKKHPGFIELTPLLKALSLYPTTEAKDYKIEDNKLVIFWDDVIPLNKVKTLFKLKHTESMPKVFQTKKSEKILYIPADIGVYIPEKYRYCTIYYSIHPVRIIMLKFKDYPYKTDVNDYSVDRIDNRLKIYCHSVLELLELEPGSTEFAYQIINDKELLILYG